MFHVQRVQREGKNSFSEYKRKKPYLLDKNLKDKGKKRM